MSDRANDTWFPQKRHFENALVLKFAKTLHLRDYDSLYSLSIKSPDKYWEALNDYLEISWSKKPSGYVDLSRGKEFPLWFPGGELNWVDTVLRWGKDAATKDQLGIVAEDESGNCVSLTYSELATLIRRFAAGLSRRGLVRGDRVGLLCETGIETTVSVLALSYIGCIVVPLFSGFGHEAIVSRLEPAGARALIATSGFSRRGQRVDVVPTVCQAIERLPGIEFMIWKLSKNEAVPADGLSWWDVASAEPAPEPAARMSPNDPFMVIYTSGTTGKPKGIVHTHSGFPLKVAHDAMIHWDIGKGDIFFWSVDMGWIAGPITVCATLMRGATLVCYDGTPDFPDWSRMSRIIERHKVTHFAAAPTMIRGMAANESTALHGDRSSVRLLVTAGEGIDAEHFTWFRKNFAQPDSPLMNSSGGTEVSGVLLSSVVVKPIRAGAFNTASPGADVAVVDSAGKEITDQVGELAVRDCFVGMTQSFWEDDSRYLETYWRAIPGIWIHGDLVVRTNDGSFFIQGRSDDTLKIAGKRVGPAEIEQVILEFEGVQEAAAIGVEDKQKGERLAVFIVLAPAFSTDKKELVQAISSRVASRLGKPFRPSEVHFVGQLPKTRSSKIMRRIIKKVCADQPLGDLSSLANPEAIDEIRTTISR